MTDIPIKIQFVKSLSTAQPSRIVAVKADGDTAFSLWVTDKTGIPYPLKDLQNNVIITNTDGKLQITSSSTSTNINLASSILATINSALQSGDNISELVNNVGYLTTFTETDPVFQASEASLFVSGDKFNLDNQSGINSGDQDSIVGISGTKEQFNTELTDGDFLFVGDVLDTPDATVTTKGILKLTGDLGGTADLPTVPNKLDKGTYLGTAQDLKEDIDNIYVPDTVIRTTEPTRVGNVFTFPVDGYEVLLNKTRRSNTAAFVTTIAAATTDYKRVDLIYFKPDNTLDKIQGVESLTVAVRPDAPVGSIAVSFINVFGATIESPTPVDNEISIQDSLGVERFKVNDYLRFKGASFNITAKQIEIDPLVGGVIFVSNAGNNATAEPENRNKPYATLDAAITAYFNFPNIIKIEIITNTTFTITRNLNNGTTRPILLYSEYTPTVNITYNGLYGFGSQIITFNIPNGTLNLAPTTSATFGSNANRVFIIIKVKTITKNAAFGGQIIGGLTIDAVNSTVTGSTGFVDACVSQPINYIKINNISFVGANARLFGTSFFSSGEWIVDFDNIIHDNTFDISCWTPKMSINHGNISSPNSFATWVSYCSLPNSSCVVSFKTNAVVSSNIGFRRFNNNGLLTLTGVVEYTNTNYLLYHVNSNNVRIVDATITTKALFNGVMQGNINIINSTISVTSYFGTITNNTPHTYVNPILTLTGMCFILGAGLSANFDLIVKGDGFALNNLRIDLSKAVLYTNGKFNRSLVSIIENPLNQYYNTIQRQLVLVDEKEEIINKVLDSTKTYIINGIIPLVAGDFILEPAGGLTIGGYGFNTSGFTKNTAGESIIKSAVGGSGDLTLKDMFFQSGAGSVFDLTDSDGSHAIEMNDVNFNGCSSLGVINGYRQFTGLTVGIYGCSDGLQIKGLWNGFVMSKLHVRSFSSSGILFKKDTDTSFSNRFSLGVNLSCSLGTKILDFDNTIFTKDKTLQLDDCTIEVDGVISTANTASLIPNITANDPKCKWTNSEGIQLSAVQFQDIKSPDGNVWRLSVNNSGVITATDI